MRTKCIVNSKPCLSVFFRRPYSRATYRNRPKGLVIYAVSQLTLDQETRCDIGRNQCHQHSHLLCCVCDELVFCEDRDGSQSNWPRPPSHNKYLVKHLELSSSRNNFMRFSLNFQGPFHRSFAVLVCYRCLAAI